MKKIYVYDLEVFKQCFLAGFINPKTGEKKIFEISTRKNNATSLYRFLRDRVKGLVGFNNLSYDNTLINYFVRTKITNPLKYYELSQKIINDNLRAAPQLIPQLDIYKVNHWDNRAKITSLKAAEARMNFYNVADLPYPFDKDLTPREIQKVVEYLHNDLEATLELYKLYKNKYYLRNEIKKKYKLKCDNWSDSKIGEQLLLKLYCEKTNSDPDLVRNLRTNRKEIIVSDIIFPYIEFKTSQLQELLETIKSEVITDTKGGFKHVFDYGGITTHLAQGGIHAAKPGIYKTTKEKIVLDLDVSGMYPSIIIANKLFPEHLGPEFTEVLRDEIVNPRLKIHKPKSKDKSLHWTERKLHAAFSDGFKLAGKNNYY